MSRNGRETIRSLMLSVVSLGLSATFGAWVQADEKAAGEAKPEEAKVEVISVTIHPAAEPKPALKYHLLPTFLEQTPGNAVPLYLKTLVFYKNFVRTKDEHGGDDSDMNHVRDWLTAPWETMPRDRVRTLIDEFEETYQQARSATLRERCDWDPPLRQGRIFDILLPEVQEARWLAFVVALRARLQVADGNYAEAVGTLQTGYAMAYQVAKQPFLVSGLVGVTITDIMNHQLLTLCQQPGAPNLYWALTELPHPMVDLRKSAEAEYDGLYLQLPELQTVRRAKLAPEQWDILLRSVVSGLLPQFKDYGTRVSETDVPLDPKAIVDQALAGVPAARKDLLAFGYSQQEIDAMSPAQIVLLHVLETYDAYRDEVFKWSHLPYWQAQQGFAAVDRKLKAEKPGELIPKTSLMLTSLEEKVVWLLPSVDAVSCAIARSERQFAVLRCIEALRLYLASHDGKLPASLDDVKEVPIPINPVTGKPFPYRLEGETAVLDADGVPANWGGDQQYRITAAK